MDDMLAVDEWLASGAEGCEHSPSPAAPPPPTQGLTPPKPLGHHLLFFKVMASGCLGWFASCIYLIDVNWALALS